VSSLRNRRMARSLSFGDRRACNRMDRTASTGKRAGDLWGFQNRKGLTGGFHPPGWPARPSIALQQLLEGILALGQV
jgi:hypothetical protein